MAHEIDFSNDRPNIAYVGTKPWHGLGSPLVPNAPIETWRIAAGLDWRAKLAPIHFDPHGPHATPDVQPANHTVPNRSVVYRDDTHDVLGVVSNRYQLVQPAEVLEFFREFVTAGDLELETAGSLAGGRRIWALAKLGQNFRLQGQDLIESYLLLATSMDGSMATTATFTTVRVVCQNTLNFADQSAKHALRIPHIKAYDPQQAKQQLGLVDAPWKSFTEHAERLADRRVTDTEAVEWLRRTFGEDPEASIDDQSNQKVLRAVWKSVKESPGAQLKSADRTAWGLLQGATHYIDHVRGKTDESRLNSAWFGEGANAKQRAFTNALALAA